MNGLTDRALVEHVVATGDAAAFGELVRRHEPRIRALLRRLSAADAARADDLAQETFLLAYRHLSTFRGESSVATWLVRIAVRQHLSDARRLRPVPTADVGDLAAPASDPSDRRALEHALAALRPEQRVVIILSFAHGFSHAEIADLTGWPVGTVKTHALRGRAALRAHLEPEASRR